jgi:mRNA interferase RelE/StbE
VKVEFKESFAKDIKRINDKGLTKCIKEIIESIEKANSLSDIKNLKKLKDSGNFYRLRVGDFRIGISFKNNTVILVRFLDRKDIYKLFP